jgi:hypothetical protein
MENRTLVLSESADAKEIKKEHGIVITAVASESPSTFRPPETLDVNGVKLTLKEFGHAIGIDKDENVWFLFEPSGDIETALVTEEALKLLKKKAILCNKSYCDNYILEGNLCWKHTKN